MKRVLQLVPVDSVEKAADLLTKSLLKALFLPLRRVFNGILVLARYLLKF